jgi:hypothetical protein
MMRRDAISMSNLWRRHVALGVLVTCGCALQAQSIPGAPPTASECDNAVQALSRGARDGTGWERLSACGAVGGAALAQALESARRESDPAYLEVLYSSLSVIRDPQVFRAALTLLQDKGATAGARIVAILTGLAQHDVALRPGLSDRVRAVIAGGQSSRCPIAPGMVVGNYRSETPLPKDYVERLATALERTSEDSDAQESVRALGRCARSMLVSGAPVRVPLTSIRMEYSCGKRVRIVNNSEEWINVTWRIPTVGDHGELVVTPRGQPASAMEGRVNCVAAT